MKGKYFIFLFVIILSYIMIGSSLKATSETEPIIKNKKKDTYNKRGYRNDSKNNKSNLRSKKKKKKSDMYVQHDYEIDVPVYRSPSMLKSNKKPSIDLKPSRLLFFCNLNSGSVDRGNVVDDDDMGHNFGIRGYFFGLKDNFFRYVGLMGEISYMSIDFDEYVLYHHPYYPWMMEDNRHTDGSAYMCHVGTSIKLPVFLSSTTVLDLYFNFGCGPVLISVDDSIAFSPTYGLGIGINMDGLYFCLEYKWLSFEVENEHKYSINGLTLGCGLAL